MKYFYIDTSSSYLYTGVVEEDKVLYEIKEKLDNNLSTFSLYLIDDMFKKIGIVPKDINKIIVVNGPGSFTGVRIGVTIAKTWAWALKIPITTVSSLKAMAISCEEKGIKVPIIDARRENYYAGIYDEENKNIMEDCHISSENLLSKLKEISGKYYFIGSANLEENILTYSPNILKIVSTVKNEQAINPHAVNPNYLKLTEAEEKLK